MALPQTAPTIQFLGGAMGDGTVMGSSSASLLGFFGNATPVTQPAMSANAAVATTAVINSSISSSCFGYTSAQATAIISLVNGIRAAGVSLGLWAT